MNLPLVVVRASRRSSSTDHSLSGASPPPPPTTTVVAAPPTTQLVAVLPCQQGEPQYGVDRLSLQNSNNSNIHQHTALPLMSIEECEKIIPQKRYCNHHHHPSFMREEADNEDRLGNGIALLRYGGATQVKKNTNSSTTTEPEEETESSTEDCTNSNQDEEEEEEEDEMDHEDDSDLDQEQQHDPLWQMAQQASDDGQRLQVYWNLCYPDGATTTTSSTTNEIINNSEASNVNAGGVVAAQQPFKSCLNKRYRTTSLKAAASTVRTNTESPVTTRNNIVTSTPTGLSPAHKKNHPNPGNHITATTHTASGMLVASYGDDSAGFCSSSNSNDQIRLSSASIQFAPSSAMEFHEDAPVHEWRVLADAAERFPTTGNASSSDEDDDNDDDEEESNSISESTWAALFALERETNRGPNLDNNDDDKFDDDESSLDGGLARLAPCRGTVSSANQLQVSASSMLSSDDSDPSLQFTMPSPRSSSNNNSNRYQATASATPYGGFHDGFRMNSDQSLGFHSTASSSSDRSLNLIAPLRSSFPNGHRKNSGNIASTIPFDGFNDGFRMNSDQSLGIHSVASSSSGRSLHLGAATRTNNHAGTIPYADFHDGFRMNSDQSLGVRSVASSSSTNTNSLHDTGGATTDDPCRALSMPSMMAISTGTATKYSEDYYPKQQGLRNLMGTMRDEETVEATRVASSLSGVTTTRHG